VRVGGASRERAWSVIFYIHVFIMFHIFLSPKAVRREGESIGRARASGWRNGSLSLGRRLEGWGSNWREGWTIEREGRKRAQVDTRREKGRGSTEGGRTSGARRTSGGGAILRGRSIRSWSRSCSGALRGR